MSPTSAPTAKANRSFKPLPGERVALRGEEFEFVANPRLPSVVSASEGARATVYRIKKRVDGADFALKVFKQVYRIPGLMNSGQHLRQMAAMEGFRAARRFALAPSDAAVRVWPDLQYAIVMPWIEGNTWFDILMDAGANGTPYNFAAGVRLCHHFLRVLARLESSRAAHTDIAPGNVILRADPIDIQLIDLEDMYVQPTIGAPSHSTTGSEGYRHPTGESTWRVSGDRYAATILACEMLLLSDASLARNATDTGFFVQDRTTPLGAERFAQAHNLLVTRAPRFADLLSQAWNSASLDSCPPITSLLQAAEELAARAAPAVFHSAIFAAPVGTHAAAPVSAVRQSSPAWMPTPGPAPTPPDNKPKTWGWAAPFVGIGCALITSQLWQVSCFQSALWKGVESPGATPYVAALSACSTGTVGSGVNFVEALSAIAGLVMTAILGYRGLRLLVCIPLGIAAGVILGVGVAALMPR